METETIRYTVEVEEPRTAMGRPSLNLSTRMHYNTGHTFGANDSLAEVTINVNTQGMAWGSIELALTNFTEKSRRTTHKSLNRTQVIALRNFCNRALIEGDAQALLAKALADTLEVFRASMGAEAWGEWIGTSSHGPGVKNDRIVEALKISQHFGGAK